MACSGEWTGSFGRSALAPGVFVVGPERRAAVRAWAVAQHGASAASSEPHGPTVTAWSVLDGGVLAVASWRPAEEALEPGFYVVGYGAFRLVTAELGLAGPTRPLPGEPLYDLDALRAAHRARSVACPDALEQAELLATCSDTRSLRRVATALTATLTTAPATALTTALTRTPRSHTLAG